MFIRGEFENSFNSYGWDISKVKANGRIYQIPIKSCMGLEGKKNFTVETALIHGALGILYIPSRDQDLSILAAFYLRNVTDSKWLRYSDFEFGSKLLSPAEFITMSEKWLEECNKGISTSCRVASYFNSHSKYELLTKSCDGGDLTGCLADSSICRCNWSLFEVNIDNMRFLAQEEKFCSSDERWASGARYRRNKK